MTKDYDMKALDTVSSRTALPAIAPADVANELWAAAQLAPGEGIEDGVHRIENILRSKMTTPKESK